MWRYALQNIHQNYLCTLTLWQSLDNPFNTRSNLSKVISTPHHRMKTCFQEKIRAIGCSPAKIRAISGQSNAPRSTMCHTADNCWNGIHITILAGRALWSVVASNRWRTRGIGSGRKRPSKRHFRTTPLTLCSSTARKQSWFNSRTKSRTAPNVTPTAWMFASMVNAWWVITIIIFFCTFYFYISIIQFIYFGIFLFATLFYIHKDIKITERVRVIWKYWFGILKGYLFFNSRI